VCRSMWRRDRRAIDILVNDTGVGRCNDANLFDRIIWRWSRQTFIRPKFCSVHMSAEGQLWKTHRQGRYNLSQKRTGIRRPREVPECSHMQWVTKVDTVSPGPFDVST
jgi:hypothetical protein